MADFRFLADQLEAALNSFDPFAADAPNVNAWPQPNVRRKLAEWLAARVEITEHAPFEHFSDEWLDGLARAFGSAEGEGAFGSEEDGRMWRALEAEFEARGRAVPDPYGRDATQDWLPALRDDYLASGGADG